MIRENFNLHLPFPEVFPKKWKDTVGPCHYVSFRNLDHFKFVVSQIRQKDDDNCDVSYDQALKDLLNETAGLLPKKAAEIRNLVRSNLHKRGLITEEVYEAFKYDVEGTQVGVDVGKYAAGEPDCILTPVRQYIDYFYELYISISYNYTITNEFVRENTARLLATIEELERQHIFIKITLVFPDRGCNNGEGPSNMFSSIPLFSHKEFKDVAKMSSVVNDRLLRKFYFAILEDLYGDDLAYGKGHPMELDTAMNIGHQFDEIEFFKDVVQKTGANLEIG